MHKQQTQLGVVIRLAAGCFWFEKHVSDFVDVPWPYCHNKRCECSFSVSFEFMFSVS